MRFTATTTTKGQLTIPKEVREKLHITSGTKVDIYPTPDGQGFIGKPQRVSNIMAFAGDLQHLDDGKSLKEIRETAQQSAAKKISSLLKKSSK